MATPLRVLILGDRPADAELALDELRRAGFEPDWRRVETEPEYLGQLDPALDLILADYGLPQLGAPRALQLLRARGLDIPFIVVSGEVGDEPAVESMKQGAADYLLKDRLARLGPAVTQALHAKRLRGARQRAAQDEVIGALAVGRPAGPSLNDEEVRLAQAFADQAAATLENARLYEEAERRRREAEVVADLARAINASLDLDTVLQRAAEGARELCQSDVAAIGLWEPDSETVVFRYWVGARSDTYRAVCVTPGKGAGGQVLLTRRPFRTDDYAADPRIARDYVAAVGQEGVVAMLVVPIRLGDRVEGLLHVANRSPRPFADRDEVILLRLADQAAIAIRNAQMFAHERVLRTQAETAEARSRTLSHRIRSLLESTGEGIYGVDLDGRCTFINAAGARMLGYKPEELLGKGMHETMHHTRRDGSPYPEGECRLVEVRRTGRGVRLDDEVLWRRDGTSFAAEHSSSPIIEGQKITGAVVTFVEITERKRTEEALRESEQQLRQAQKMEAIGRLAGGIAHDFNNLLTVILGRSQMLLHTLEPGDPGRQHVTLIQQSAERAGGLTQQLLAFSRKQVLQPRVLNLNTVVAGVEEILRRLIGEDVELVPVHGSDLWRVKADPGQLEQVILNLAVNARDAMPTGGQLTIETANVGLDDAFVRGHVGARSGPHVRLAVSDTGVGMDAAIQAHLFEPFFTTKEPGKGTGLGLATVYGIVKQSDGYISVESAPGRGARFEVYLPRVDEVTDRIELAPTLVAPYGGSETIFLVEDEDDLRELGREILEGQGYTVLEARNGREALEIGERHPGPIHLLMTDVVMPQMGGRELAERLVERRPETKVLYVSGYTADAIGQHGVLEANVTLLWKPFTPDALARKVREVLEKSR